MAVKPVILCLNRAGEATAHRIAKLLDAPVHGRDTRVDQADVFFANALDHTRMLFQAGTPVIGVCASGILIRAVAPVLADKTTEPPMLSVSDDGAVVVPLLGGHRGANRLAAQIARALGATAAVTTAGDVALGVALDEPPAGYRLANPENAKDVMAKLLSGAGATLTGDAPWLVDLPEGDDVTIACTTAPANADLIFHPQQATLGVGCARNCAPEELHDLVIKTLTEANIAPAALKAIYTLDLKADEPAVHALSRALDIPVRVFDAATLEAETPRLQNPSDVVFAEVGTHGVSEAAALAGAGDTATLIAPKQKTKNATCAIALAPAPITELRGRARGKLSIIGIGPGQHSWRTPEASQLVNEAEELVGYGLYIDLLGPLAYGKHRSDFPLGGEEERCRYALERAGEGRNVALICSGDAGIYA
uniref:cobalamin biosynthesis protein n=1 Tax=Litoreibacter halocynthiae TaxID=1242689 RepID=UPI00249237A6